MTAVTKITGQKPTPISMLLDGHQKIGTGFIVGEDVAAGDAVTLTPNTSAISAGVPIMQIMRANGSSAGPLAICVGFAAQDAKVAQQDALTIVTDSDWRYGTGFVTAFLSGATGPVFVYLSASVPGGIDTAPPFAGAQPVGMIIDDSRIRLWGSASDGDSYLAPSVPPVAKVIGLPFTGGTDTGGGILAWENPETTPIIITKMLVDVQTPATGACTLETAGNAATATTAAATLIAAKDVHTSAVLLDNVLAANLGATSLKVGIGKYVTLSTASGASAGLAGIAYIHYITVAS